MIRIQVDEATGDHVCEHGTALDVHCCNCHSGFMFYPDECLCKFAVPECRCGTREYPRFDPECARHKELAR